MPPQVDYSDDESSGGSIPFKEPELEEKAAEENDEDESDDEGEDVFVVEKILGHQFDKKGKVLYQVKWKGYENPEDMTLEPEDNLEGAPDALNEYFEKVGGRPEKPSKKRKSTGPISTPDQAPSKKAKKTVKSANGPSETEQSADWLPESSNWDKEVQSVETILRHGDNLYALLTWNNGKKSKLSLQLCYDRCPQKMLKFYENHLVFKEEA